MYKNWWINWKQYVRGMETNGIPNQITAHNPRGKRWHKTVTGNMA